MMLAAKKGKIRGQCPQCRHGVWLADDELGELFSCNICGTEFRVERLRRFRRKPGYWKCDMASETGGLSGDVRARQRVGLYGLRWLIAILLTVAGLLGVLLAHHWLSLD